MPFFEIIHQSTQSHARVGRIHTAHGIIETPGFVPVCTNGALKAVESSYLDSLGVDLIFCNTYHLLVHPGADIVGAAGGIHTFMNRKKPVITDSGGFQVFSLAYGGVTSELKSSGTKKNDGAVIKISEEGVLFRSYRDGSLLLLTPESSVQAQKSIGADIIIPLDELPPYHIDKQALKKSFERTHRWEARSLQEHLKNPQHQHMYSVIHGGLDQELRKKSIEILDQLPFDGHAIGGSLGKNRHEMREMLFQLMPHMRHNKPIHLLGIGDLESLEDCLKLGIDTFDSSYPTKCARHGMLFTSQGTIKIKQSQFKSHYAPLDPACSCITCTHYTASYVHHLFKSHEITAYTLATIHNIAYMVNLMGIYRNKILNNEY